MGASRCKDIETDIVQKEEHNDSEDRISKLSNDVIQHIFSSLTLKEAISTKALSKSWGRVFPVQHFKFSKHIESTEFMDSVNESLQSISKWKEGVLILSLHTWGVNEKHEPCLDKWIKATADNNFQVLRISFRDIRRYSLPPTIFASKQLTVLSLSRCQLKDDYSLSDDTARLDCLQDLSLVDVQLSETILNRLISISPSIMNFALKQCEGVKFLRLQHLGRLERVVVHDNLVEDNSIDGMEIEAHSLRTFEFFSRLTKNYEIDMKHCKNLEISRLDTITIPGWFIENLIPCFPHLKSLYLFGKHESDRLENLSTRVTWCLQKTKVCFEPNCSTPSLINTSWFVELKEFIRKVCSREVLSLYFPAKEAIVTFHGGELRDVVFTPELRVKHLKLVFWYYKSASSSFALVDGVLWSCHPEMLTVKLYGGKENNINVEVLLHQLKNRKGDKKNCCKSTQIKCWRHYLKGVEIDQFTSTRKKERDLECGKIRFRFKW